MSRILLADDHPMFRDAMRHMIDTSFTAVEFTEVHTFSQALAAARSGGPFDLAFVDLIMPGAPAPLDGIAQLRSAMPDTPMLVVSSQDDRDTVDGALALGVAAFISKSASKSDIEGAIRSVLAGEVASPVERSPQRAPGEALSPRQTAVLELLARGRSNRQIAGDLNVEEITVKAHISAILRKLHVKSRLEAVVVSRSVLKGPQ